MGRNVAICGKAIRMTTHITIVTTNGNIPRNMVYIGMSLAIPLMTKTFMPTGGVIIAISHINTTITPNHIGSYPRAKTTGVKIGMVSNIIARESIIQPRKT